MVFTGIGRGDRAVVRILWAAWACWGYLAGAMAGPGRPPARAPGKTVVFSVGDMHMVLRSVFEVMTSPAVGDRHGLRSCYILKYQVISAIAQ